jgi:hypothetical protein
MLSALRGGATATAPAPAAGRRVQRTDVGWLLLFFFFFFFSIQNQVIM